MLAAMFAAMLAAMLAAQANIDRRDRVE